jgi:Ca2+-transporting ATPase
VAPPDPEIMRRPPRDPKESVFTRDVMVFILMALLIEVPFFSYLFFRERENMLHARTHIFFLFIIVELVIALNFRSLRYSVFTAPPHRWLLAAIVWELVLVAALVQVPSLREAFGIVLPAAPDLAVVAVFSLVVFLSMEVLKAVLRSKAGRGGSGAAG